MTVFTLRFRRPWPAHEPIWRPSFTPGPDEWVRAGFTWLPTLMTQQRSCPAAASAAPLDESVCAAPGAGWRTERPRAVQCQAASSAARTVALSSVAAASAGTERRSPVRRSRISTVPSLDRSRPTTTV